MHDGFSIQPLKLDADALFKGGSAFFKLELPRLTRAGRCRRRCVEHEGTRSLQGSTRGAGLPPPLPSENRRPGRGGASVVIKYRFDVHTAMASRPCLGTQSGRRQGASTEAICYSAKRAIFLVFLSASLCPLSTAAAEPSLRRRGECALDV